MKRETFAAMVASEPLTRSRFMLPVIDRRALIIGVLSIVLAAPCTSAVQQTKVYRIGFLFAGTLAQRPQAQGFWEGLQGLGYIPGKDVVIEVREAEGRVERLPQLAEELVSWKPDVLVAVTPAAVTAAQRATATIPIVMAITSDPTGRNHVRNLARPEGNITGPSIIFDLNYGKRLQLLREMLPNVSRVAIVWNKNMTIPKGLEEEANSLGVRLQSLPFQGPDDLINALTAGMRERPEALLIIGDAVTFDKRGLIIAFAASNRIPAFYSFADEAVDGGLAGYGVNLRKEYRWVAPYVDKILRGAKPADLPVEQSTTYELVINLKTAKALGLTIPRSLLLRADEVIQ